MSPLHDRLARPSVGLLLTTCIVALANPAAAQDAGFRVRSDLAAPLNANSGWAGEVGEQVVVEADRPFRLRLEATAPGNAARLALQVWRNDGPWEALEAHDFPYPTRELELDFTDMAAGSSPTGWQSVAGDSGNLVIVGEGGVGHLRATGGQDRLVAIHAAPWPLPEFSIAARFRLPAGAQAGFDVVFGFVDAANHGLVRLDTQGRMAIIQVVDGTERVVAESAAPITPDTWHEIEVQLEAGQVEASLDDGAAELTAPLVVPAGDPGLAVPPGGSVDLAAFVIEGVARTPGVSIVATPANRTGEPTTDLIAASSVPFRPGYGISLAERTPQWAGEGAHGEFEWPLVIRRMSDGPTVSQQGDRFAFRMVDAAGYELPGSAVAQVSLAVPPGHLGGTFVENPGRIGPWQAGNGDLYFIMEPSETDNKFMMMKSADGGASWHEVDAANRPATRDLESVDGRQVGERIHIVHQVTRSVRYHVFRTSDHPTHPDTWELRDEVAARADAIAQTATMVVRPDGSVVTVFLADRLHYAVRGVDGTWSAPAELDPGTDRINAGPQAVVDRAGTVHLAYFTDDGGIWYRRLMADGTLTARQQVAQGAGTGRAEYGAVLPLAYDGQSDSVIVVYRLADGILWERRVQGGQALSAPVAVTGGPVITDAVDSQQAAADVVFDGRTAHVLFIDQAGRRIFSTREEQGRWQAPQLRVGGIEGSWVRGNVLQRADGARVYGYIYDAGSRGGTGMNRYAELMLEQE